MTGQMATSPNAGIPAGLVGRRKGYDQDGIKTAKSHAAGILFVAPDGDVLMLRRSPKEGNFGGHWALPGGGVDDGETPEQGAIREAREEMGVDAEPERLRDIEKVVTPTGKAFHTFALPVAEKFVPKLNDEHTGYAWASLDMLPRPMHPAVESMLKTRLGMADDMKPEDWAGMRDGFLKWTAEEELEEEHQIGATDSALHLALDRDTVREYRKDGQLVVTRARITKANVCPYRGSEIPGWEALGLDADVIYNLLRDPDELRKAAPTLNGVQLLAKHKPVSADDHKPNDTVGSLGTDAQFVEEGGENYLVNSLFVNAQSAIDGIESGKKRELSAGYHYTPDMTPGNFRGTAFDGIMRDIVFNHVALVEDGRAGPDVVVGDSMENLMSKPTKLGLHVMGATALRIAPLIAMDQKVVFPAELVGIFKGLTTKNFKTSKEKLLDGVKLALDGKTRKGLAMDGPLADLKKAVDSYEEFAGEGADKPTEETMMDTVEPIEGEVQGKVFDDGNVAQFLRGKGMGEDDIKTVCDMMPKAIAGDEDDEEAKKKAEAEEAERKKKEGAMDKQAMDAAITSAVSTALTTERKNQTGIRAALSDVRDYVGEIPASMAFDSASDVYRHALVMKGVDGAKTMHADALPTVLKTLPKIGSVKSVVADTSHLAMDASAISKAQKIAPGLEHISSI